jgi:serine/threonine-protein kinase
VRTRAAAPESDGKTAGDDVICHTCNTANVDLARFCSNCGRVFETLPAGRSAIDPRAASARVPADMDDEVTRVSPVVSASHAAPLIATRAEMATPTDQLIGRTIEGKYVIESKLGAGGMGAVYKARRLLIGDEVAIKILHPQHVSEPQANERFRREAQAAARLKHPNAVSIYDFGVTAEGLVYLVMELVEGQSLRQILKQQGPLSPAATAEVINPVCAALDEAHRQQIVHRDLKPDNIIVNPTIAGLRVKVLDFGIAKLRDMAASSLTQTGSVLGTPHYMSPEQCLGEDVDSRSDIYSLGVVLFEMLSGVVPFNSPISTAVVIQHVNQAPPSIRAINSAVSPAVEAVVLHALAKRREDRPPTAGLLAHELNSAVNPWRAEAPTQQDIISRGPLGDPAPGFQQNPTMMPTTVMSSVSGSGGFSASPTSPYQPVAPTFSSHPQPAASRSLPVALLAVVGVLSLILVFLAAYLIFFSFSAKKTILTEVRRGNLVKPQGSSAYDLFLKYKSNDLKAAEVDDIAREVVPAMDKRGNEIFANVRQDPSIESEDDWSEAIRLYSWLNDLKPSKSYEARRYCAEGRIALLKKDYDSALSGFQRSLERDPSSALTLNSIGRVYYLGKKDKGTAEEYYRRATVAEPGWIAPWINLGALCLEIKDYPTGEAALKQAIQINPQKASPHSLLAQTLENEDRPCEALSEYQLALDNAANNPNASINVDSVRRRVAALNSKGMICSD